MKDWENDGKGKRKKERKDSSEYLLLFLM